MGISKEKEILERLKNETTISEIHGEFGVNFYQLKKWFEDMVSSKKLLCREAGKFKYYKLK